MNAPIAPGDVLLGKYRVERILGQGGMGVVVAARHLELGELFAIKFLLPQAGNNPQAIERFVREARASAKLKGEHVAKVHDVGRLADGLPYMVLEHLVGKDLKETIRERKQLPVIEAVTYVLQACEAIAEAHGNGIIHRDLKPANLFLTRRSNGSPCVKVLDFGISRQLEPENPEQHGLTKTGMLLGSPYYMSPEQMLRTKEADARSDIWSLGCVLYELLAGKVPFHAEALTELVGKVLQEEAPPPSMHRGDIPPAVEAVVMRCLTKRKELRFQTVQELGDALRAAITVAPQATPIPVPAVRSSIPSQQNYEATVPLPESSPVAAIFGPVPPVNTAPGWGTTSPDASRASRAKNRVGVVVGAVAVLGALGGGIWFKMRQPSVLSKGTTDAPSVTAQSALVGETASVAAPVAAPPVEPTPTEASSDSPPVAEPTSKPSAQHKASLGANGHVARPGPLPLPPAPPSAKPTAEPSAPPPVKKRGTMF